MTPEQIQITKLLKLIKQGSFTQAVVALSSIKEMELTDGMSALLFFRSSFWML
jgi:hypothetical protein